MQQITEIRKLLDELELAATPSDSSAKPKYLGTELQTLVCDVADFLQPLLTPYAAAFYWFLLRQSLIETGRPYLRVGTRRLQSGVVKSPRSEKVSQSQVQELLSQLELIGAIRREGEPNRQGTLYKVLAPEEINACRQFRSETAPIISANVNEADIDYYNVRENRQKVYERDNFVCRYCSKQLTTYTATLDHITPVAAGGNNTLDNLVTSCLSCNSRKTSRAVGDFLAEGSSVSN